MSFFGVAADSSSSSIFPRHGRWNFRSLGDISDDPLEDLRQANETLKQENETLRQKIQTLQRGRIEEQLELQRLQKELQSKQSNERNQSEERQQLLDVNEI